MFSFSLKKKKKDVNSAPDLGLNMIGDNLSFAASEAYKLLRTNIQLSLPNKDKCKAIGITSSDSGEGKSTTAINLAYTFGVSDKKVLLIEGDMRKPTVSKRLGVEQTPGLSNILVNMAEENDCFKSVELNKNITLLPAGDIPPNPSELLASDTMAALLEKWHQSFDYIIFDLPPINVVTDALVISQLLDGICIVVRSDVTSKREVNEVIRSLQFANAKILGFILTDTDIFTKSYGRKKYGRYGKYYKSYESYDPAAKKTEEKQ